MDKNLLKIEESAKELLTEKIRILYEKSKKDSGSLTYLLKEKDKHLLKQIEISIKKIYDIPEIAENPNLLIKILPLTANIQNNTTQLYSRTESRSSFVKSFGTIVQKAIYGAFCRTKLSEDIKKYIKEVTRLEVDIVYVDTNKDIIYLWETKFNVNLDTTAEPAQIKRLEKILQCAKEKYGKKYKIYGNIVNLRDPDIKSANKYTNEMKDKVIGYNNMFEILGFIIPQYKWEDFFMEMFKLATDMWRDIERKR